MQGRCASKVPVLPEHPGFLATFAAGRRPAPRGLVFSRQIDVAVRLFARPSRSGAWCAAVGMPHLSAEAARAAGVDLSRLVLIPEPGERQLAVTAAIADVLPVVAVRPLRASPATSRAWPPACASARRSCWCKGRGRRPSDDRRRRPVVVGHRRGVRTARRQRADRHGDQPPITRPRTGRVLRRMPRAPSRASLCPVASPRPVATRRCGRWTGR